MLTLKITETVRLSPHRRVPLVAASASSAPSATAAGRTPTAFPRAAGYYDDGRIMRIPAQ
jgi:hypothetical protein